MTTEQHPAAGARWQAWRSAISAGLVALALAACTGPGTDTAAALEPHVVTHFTDQTELFVEFAPLVAGERSNFAAHFTVLDGYAPVAEGTVDVVLSGGGAPTERFRVREPRAPGIFAPTAAPRAAGERELSLTLTSGALSVRHDLGTITVHPSRQAAAAAGTPRAPGPQGEILMFKEQQWQSDFALELVQPRPLRESVSAPATVRASADGAFRMVAPTAGLVRASGAFPALGDAVARGQVLARLVPRLADGVDGATLQSDLAAARSEAGLARTEAARMQRLHRVDAVSQRRLDEARAALQVAQSRLGAAEQRNAQLGGGGSGVELRAAIGGRLAQVAVANGAAVEAGDLLFHIVDRDELWIEAQVSESDAARLRRPDGIAFDLPGLEQPVEVRDGVNGRLVGVGSVIDEDSRSLPVVFALDDPDPRILLNQVVQARVFTGGRRDALSVPASAVIDDGGERVVYVMRGGESFSRVPVRLGLRDGDRYQVLEGLRGGERVVARGAMQVRLAAATPEAMGHGHAH